jgi:hypothetical protein
METSKQVVDKVWEKARATGDQDPTVWRKDECGAWINYDHYGSEESAFGWRILNVSVGASNELDDLRPFHRENNFNRNTGFSVCRVKADREATRSTAQLDAPRNMPA